ncbi:MAG: hypothetical protein JWO41_763 [Candidatus Saccharibacteria bacterium]|nr:hypothetical protein [Candidatus Saccharibacteria bacterium]
MVDHMPEQIETHSEAVSTVFDLIGGHLVDRQVRVTRAAEHFQPFSSRHLYHIGQVITQPDLIEGRVTSTSEEGGFIIVDGGRPYSDTGIRTWRVDVGDKTVEPPIEHVTIDIL